jgi:hypothetical protein
LRQVCACHQSWHLSLIEGCLGPVVRNRDLIVRSQIRKTNPTLPKWRCGRLGHGVNSQNKPNPARLTAGWMTGHAVCRANEPTEARKVVENGANEPIVGGGTGERDRGAE